MPSLAESLAKARETAAAAPAGAKRRRVPETTGSGTSPDDLAQLVEHSLRLGAQLADKVEGAVSATNVVVLLCSTAYKDAMLQALHEWLDSKPEWVKGSPATPHPLGEKRIFLLSAFLELVVQDLSGFPAASEAVKVLQAMDVDDLLRWISNFRPRFAQPKEGRPWVFEVSISVLSNDAFRKAWDTLASQVRLEAVRIEPQRWSQTQVQKQVWDDLKKLSAARN